MVSKRTGVDQMDTMKTIEALMKIIPNEVSSGKTIFLRGFGTIGPKIRQRKVARNISQGTSFELPAQYVPFFKPCDQFKEAVKNNLKLQTA